MLNAEEIQKLTADYLIKLERAKERGDKARAKVYDYQLRLLEVATEHNKGLNRK